MLKPIHVVVAALLAYAPLVGILQASAQSTGIGTVAPQLSSQEFASRAWAAGQFAISASELALRRSQDPKVRDLAKSIIEDYEHGNAFLMEAAAVNRIKLPDKLDADLTDLLNRLSNASVGEIDAMFTEAVSQMHRLTIPLFTEYARSGENLSLRFLASQALPTLKEYYGTVQQLASR